MFLFFSRLTPETLRASATNSRRSSAVPHLNCSVCQPPTTSFSTRPIGTREALARMLQHSVTELQQISVTADKRYRIGKQELKKDGTLRICYDAIGQLKSIQARIQC